MSTRLKSIYLLSLVITFVFCTTTTTDSDDGEDGLEPEFRHFAEYETWKPSAQPSAPEVILIKQKDPHSDHSDAMSSWHSTIKHHLPLLAVLAPLIAVSVLLPLKAYLGPSYVIYPPVTTAAPPPASKKDRAGKSEKEVHEHSLAMQMLNMIEEMDRVYEEMALKDKES